MWAQLVTGSVMCWGQAVALPAQVVPYGLRATLLPEQVINASSH